MAIWYQLSYGCWVLAIANNGLVPIWQPSIFGTSISVSTFQVKCLPMVEISQCDLSQLSGVLYVYMNKRGAKYCAVWNYTNKFEIYRNHFLFSYFITFNPTLTSFNTFVSMINLSLRLSMLCGLGLTSLCFKIVCFDNGYVCVHMDTTHVLQN